MDKKTIIAVVLCIAVWLIWQAIFVEPPEKMHHNADGGLDGAVAQAGPEKDGDNSIKEKEGKEKKTLPPSARPDEKTVSLKTKHYTAIWSSRGANLKSMILNDYKERSETKKASEWGPEDLVSTADERKRPFSISFRSEKTGFKLPEYTDWQVLNDEKDSLTFRYDIAAEDKSLYITKRYKTSDLDYVIDLEVAVHNQGSASITEQIILDNFAGYEKIQSSGCMGASVTPRAPTCMANGDLMSIEAEPGKAESAEPQVLWTGINEQYFLIAAVARGVEKAVCKMAANHDQTMVAELMYPETDIPPGGKAVHNYRLYVGPKRLSLMEKVNGGAGSDDQSAQLVKSVDFGWFAFLCHPLLWLLKTFFTLVGNYGIAIIFLTIVIKIVLLPLTQKSMRSMKEMSKIKPLMDDLKKRCGDDKQRMNQEMMKLYKTHKVNPMGGCLPMLLQMPIWFALYRMLYSSIELYQMPFIKGWVDDLSFRDPYFIMPIVLGVAMFLQQKLSPTTADSQQAKMMMYAMPVFFTFIMLYLPSGLVLYIFVNSLLSIGHQLLYNRMTENNPKAGAPAAGAPGA
ncbi:MAG TPA: membrane protein insertase YidC [Myxococcota bacterium]|nr:membrane protein insertase YidC [Myxococcota bacterium]